MPELLSVNKTLMVTIMLVWFSVFPAAIKIRKLNYDLKTKKALNVVGSAGRWRRRRSRSDRVSSPLRRNISALAHIPIREPDPARSVGVVFPGF